MREPLLPLHLLALNADASLPWRLAVSSGIAVGLPALIGLLAGNTVGALMGAIGGLYATLLDYGGTARHRLMTQAFGLFVIVGSGAVGLWLGPHHIMMFVTLAVLTFLIGWHDGLGVALDNIFRFAALALVLYAYLTAPPAGAFIYLAFGIGVGVISVLVDDRLWPRALPRQHPGLRNSFRRLRAGHNAGIWHALGLSLTTCAAFWLAQHTHYPRPAWVATVVLFVTRPDGIDSLTRLFRSVFGAVVGVAIAWLIAHLTPQLWALYAWAVLFAFLRPLALARNFWAHYALMTAMILLLFDLLYYPSGNHVAGIEILGIRLHGVLLGSVIALVGMVIFNGQARRYFVQQMRDYRPAWLGGQRDRQG